jgi:hypothetical protein
MSDSSPDGIIGNKSSKTWAEEAKTSASNSAASASASASSASASASAATNASNSANASKQSASASANSASASASSASDSATSASNAKISETNAAKSASAAAQSAENAKTWDPTQYVQSVTESNGKVTVTKGGGESTTFNAGLNILARNKAYSVGDIAYSPNLPSYLYLECMTAGTTGVTEPDMSTLSGGAIIKDGTAQFSVKTVCAKEYVDSVSGKLQAQFNDIQAGVATLTNLDFEKTEEWYTSVSVPVNFEDSNYVVQLTLGTQLYCSFAALSYDIKDSKHFIINIWVHAARNSDLSDISYTVHWLAIHK